VQVFIQGHDVTVTDYVEYFMALVGVVVQNLNVEDCVEGHGLFSTDEEFEMLQKEDTSKAAVRQQGQKGIRGILSPHHVYIDTCATFASTPYPHLLTNLKKEERALMGHSNMGSGGMEKSRQMGAVKQM
jgi:hypothetical protein